MRGEVVSFKGPEELAEAAASAFIRELGTATSRTASFSVALSGGRIARLFFAATARLAKPRAELLRNVHFFWGDERCVPPTDLESNYGIAHELLFAPMATPEGQIHRVRGEDPPDQAAATASKELLRFTSPAADGQPIVDLILLGMGEDGHVASLFPGEAQGSMDSPAVYRAVTASKPPPHRITLGYEVIAAARQVWVLASGSGKEKALRESLAPNGRTPLARVLAARGYTKVFSDIALAL